MRSLRVLVARPESPFEVSDLLTWAEVLELILCIKTLVKSQTMNYVGQLAGQMFVQVKELYKGLNPATLSGCIDVIVVRQPDGSFQCSPFHVRFGKMGVLRSREKVVDIEINGEPINLHMKLGQNGEAFFVQETEDDKEIVPSHLATSPIITEGAALMEAQMMNISLKPSNSSATFHTVNLGSDCGVISSSAKKRRRKRRKSKMDTLKREDNGEYSEGEDMFPLEMSSDETELTDTLRSSIQGTDNEVKANRNVESIGRMSHSYCDAELLPFQSKDIVGKSTSHILPVLGNEGLSVSCPQESSFFKSLNSCGSSRPSTPKSDSELVTKSAEKLNHDIPNMQWDWGELPQEEKPLFLPKAEQSSVVNIPVSENTHFRVISSCSASEYLKGSTSSPSVFETVASMRVPEVHPGSTFRTDLEVSMSPELPGVVEQLQCVTQPQPTSKMESPSKKKDKRSRHLGADGVYLDDITEMEPEVAALYFPKSDANVPGRNYTYSDYGVRSANQSPQSVGSSGMDSGVESFSDQIADLPSIAVSLCGGLIENKEITKEQFQEKLVTYQIFSENPAIIDDPNLVVKIGSKYYNWTTAAPLMLSMQAFQKPLPKATVENIIKEKMPKKGSRWWFSWRGRNSNVKQESSSDNIGNFIGHFGNEPPGTSSSRLKDESSSSDEDPRTSKKSSPLQQESLAFSSSVVTYKKTLRLTSDQLRSLHLKDGPNDVIFSVTTQYQGTCRCVGTIYLWNWDDKIVISDIDGTITRSDTLGHILPTLGKDWTHQGIARLYHKVSQNGYKFLYCSARAIGMADMTRGYLHWVNERGTMLPQGPVLLSPSSLFSALHREVIEKKPEKFKIECLKDIRNLFHPNTEPFYAAFGNRPTDVYSYKEVGVPLNRIFTVNPKGELIQEHAKTNVSSYVRLGEVVDHVFPLLKRGDSSDFPCSDVYSQFTYWREPLQPMDNPDVHIKSS
ncbi:phosphatidate phosphatase LPIN1 isoform X2 [Erpetoichthys calabaricus]|uniref:phosphatidate phosphatase LPIN1 isoform X2 n=1 Tax=Erpetoichthys calabaricus TaxID=27687 RepID=UPI00109FEB91|nr:phosphatidate phosphatase LPIN1 isoform X2 [Erpetoichthys calabaricus]